jgi:prepilin-type N-terminal cleavage/methylation domain-containing protein
MMSPGGCSASDLRRQREARQDHVGKKILYNRRGYSFIELLTVIVVLGIMLAMAFMSMAPQIQRAKVRNAASVVAGDLQYAQLQAVRFRRPIAVVVNTVTKQIIVRDRDNPPGTIWRTRSLGQETDWDLDLLTASPTTVEVYPNGIARQTTTFSVGLDSHSRTVTLSRAGQIRIQ